MTDSIETVLKLADGLLVVDVIEEKKFLSVRVFPARTVELV